MGKKVLVIGSGGREHALGWKLAQSPCVSKLFFAPGNGGTMEIGENVPICATNVRALLDFALKKGIDLTVVGPERALAAGVVDAFRGRGLPAFGPSQFAARIETSKSYGKSVMRCARVPTLPYEVFDNYDEAVLYVRRQGTPIVVKANGPAEGKGVTVCKTLEGAKEALRRNLIDRIHGHAGSRVLVEEYQKGPEVSALAFTDGIAAKSMPLVADYKQLYPDGPNTGGMGAYGPVPWANKAPENRRWITDHAIYPALKTLCGTFTGCLYAGVLFTQTRGPRVLEYNARFGDPETQVLMRLLQSDLYPILQACVEGNLEKARVRWRKQYAVCGVLASRGYPDEPETGFPMKGLLRAAQVPRVVLFHAGTRWTKKEGLVTSGGRVLNITATADTLEEARHRMRRAIAEIYFDGMQCRRDIAEEVA